MLLLLLFWNFAFVDGARPPPPSSYSFDIYHIKTPQLIGIVFGCIVFTLTVTSVAALLYKSGTFDRLQSEMASGEGIKIPKIRSVAPQVSDQPELYDSLVEASNTLPLKLTVPQQKGREIAIRSLVEDDFTELYAAGNGGAIFSESAYDPERIWGWLPNFTADAPYSDIDTFRSCMKEDPDSSNIAILDPVLDRVIGMASLVKNSPKNLSIEIDNIWLTPSYQNKKLGHEAVLLLVDFLVSKGYRRITAAVDSRHLIGRKFLERCGFKMESILRKHRIVKNRNRDSAMYVILNSEWLESAVKLKKYLGIDPKPKTVRLADIQEADKLFPIIGAREDATNKGKKKTKKKK